jgi:hypothetical protein
MQSARADVIVITRADATDLFRNKLTKFRYRPAFRRGAAQELGKRTNMKQTFGILTLTLFLGVMTAAAQKNYCFENAGLNLKQSISFTLTGTKIEGTMESGGYEPDTSAETFDFEGTKSGNILTIRFSGKPPYEAAPGTKIITWIFAPTRLRVAMYGKNYTTGKFTTYSAIFATCKK